MKTKLLKNYRKHFALMLFLSLNICVNFTPDGLSIGMKQTFAQNPEGPWQTGISWLDELLINFNYTPGTYFNNGNGDWSYCPDCMAHVNLYEITVYGTDMSNTPVDLSLSDLWYSIPTNNLPQWSYWDFTGGVWQTADSGGGTSGNEGYSEDGTLKTWDQTTNDNISTLANCIQSIVYNFINKCQQEHGITVRIYQSFRTIEEQNELYAQGRTQEELNAVGLSHVIAQPNLPKVTNAKGGESYHNYGLAFDCVEILDGQALWNNSNWSTIASVGSNLGLTWGGSFNDKPHFQLDNKSIGDLQNGANPCN